MSKTHSSKRRLTMATLLLAGISQAHCGSTDMPPGAANQVVLDVQLVGADYGSVSSAPAGITCGDTCKASFDSGTSVTLTATAVAGATFVGWGGSCQGADPTCTVTLKSGALVTAQFMRQGVPLTVTKSGFGTGTVSSQPAGISCGAQCQNGYDAGTSVTLTATADAGSLFLGWGGACSGSAATCTVKMDAATQVDARFGTPAPTVSSVGPYYVGRAGGTQVTIQGSGFQASSQVLIGGTPATGVTYVSPTQLKATVPAGAQAGCAALVVKNPDNQQASVAAAVAYTPTTLQFAAATATGAVAASPVAVRAADLDADGKPDLLVATSSGKVQFLRGAGDGTFGAAVDVLSNQGLTGLELVDLNKDGKLDALATSSDNSTVFALLGKGDGTFTQAAASATGSAPYGLALGDVNGDGYVDVVTANYGGASASVLLGKGDGTFAASTDVTVGGPAQAVQLGDVNNDTHADLVVAASDGNAYVLLGNGDGTFQTASAVNVVGDLRDAALADVDGDGYLDLAVCDYAGTDVKVRKGDAAADFAQAISGFTLGSAAGVTYPRSVRLLDLDLDGKLDVVATSQENGISYFLNQGGAFAGRVDLAAGAQPMSLVYQDVNGDCLPDLVTVAQGDGVASVLLNKSQ
jgi:hypothetical protein